MTRPTMGVFENRYGGRICVSGYYPWSFMESLSKSSQMKSVFRWLSKEQLPGYIDSFHKVSLWIREPQNGTISLAVANASFDDAENVALMLRTENDKITILDRECNETTVRASETDGVYKKFIIPRIGAWQVQLITNE